MSFLSKNGFSFLRLGLSYLTGRSYPFVVVLRLNDACNLSCVYCDSPKFNESIDFERLEKFLNQVYARGCRLFVLTGGEPFLYKNRMRLLQWFKSRKSYLIVNTNGKLIDHPQHQIQYRNFLDATDEVLISIDGPEDVTDHHRGVGTFKNVIQTLDYLKSKKIKPTLSAVLTRKTLNLETLEFLKGLKVKYGASIGLSPVTEDGRINNKDFSLSNRPSPEQLTLMKDFVLARKQIFPEINSILLDYFIKPRAIQCKTMRFALYVDVDHQIYPCINVTGRKDAQLGDIDHYNSKFDQKVVCDKCSCTPLIVGNLLLQSKIPKPTYITTILSRYLRRPTH